MGNLDLIFIFNDSTVIKVMGNEYTTERESFKIALDKYYDEAKEAIDYWHKAKQEDPKMAEDNFSPEDDWEIKSIKRYETVL